MIPNDPALTFAVTLKRWFASNNWPQKITDDWARDVGNSTGPWASQVCNAMKASGYNPKAEFFLALAQFNKVVADQELLAITDTKLKDRLTGASPLCLENGQPYGGAEFWSLYAGLIDPPEVFNKAEEMTQEDVDAAMQLMRDNFRQVSLDYMVSPATAWQMVHAAIIECGEKSGVFVSPDDLQQFREVLAGLYEHTPETLVPIVKRYGKHDPIVCAFQVLLKDDIKKRQPIA
uniref:Uncharacterized protein n=1 Tax=uncultured organism MedDCM-OCT-S09-C20 TaxID=743645 RepID=D6PKY2_9ZZZZ|nr:hypothetical protein [uncultured organism MedDCM-OCT-S09-C20]